MPNLKSVLIQRDGLTSEQADEQISEVKEHLMDCIEDGNYEDAFYVMDDLGLEPDYLEDLI